MTDQVVLLDSFQDNYGWSRKDFTKKLIENYSIKKLMGYHT